MNYKGVFGETYHQFIKRKKYINGEFTKYYDIVMLYGYGGLLIINTSNKIEQINQFKNYMKRYCSNNKIVSEYIRFHPLLNNAIDMKEYCKLSFQRKTVTVDLTKDDLIYTEVMPKTRNLIRKAKKNGVFVEFDFKGETIENFGLLYYETMKKNNADNYYYFDNNFFKKILIY